jgi:hypothetical protein
MNFPLIAVLLLAAGLNAAHAQDAEPAAEPAAAAVAAPADSAPAGDGSPDADKKPGIQISIDATDGDPEAARRSAEETKDKIKDKIALLVERALEAKLEGSEEAQREIEQAARELEKEIEDIEASGDEINIDVSDLLGLEHGDVEEFSGVAMMAMLIPIIGIALTFGTPLLIVAFLLYAAHRKRRMNHEIINQYLASGKDIPPEVLNGLFKETAAAPKNLLHRGMILSGIGAGLFLFLLIVGGIEAASIGLIPLFIGIAQILIWKLEGGGSGSKAGAGAGDQ